MVGDSDFLSWISRITHVINALKFQSFQHTGDRRNKSNKPLIPSITTTFSIDYTWPHFISVNPRQMKIKHDGKIRMSYFSLLELGSAKTEFRKLKTFFIRRRLLSSFGGNRTNFLWVITHSSVPFKRKKVSREKKRFNCRFRWNVGRCNFSIGIKRNTRTRFWLQASAAVQSEPSKVNECYDQL